MAECICDSLEKLAKTTIDSGWACGDESTGSLLYKCASCGDFYFSEDCFSIDPRMKPYKGNLTEQQLVELFERRTGVIHPSFADRLYEDNN
ncbi:hypothetical protein HOL21_03525 [Candidatus Woesearchaeota archaeon]|jgi:hypothetical protein|nr:hypothetical protein [Candidatus Woesearchaeota archaeon]MBT5397257.1 hypothetical protein [Candidatus Woesearchaeota archaeon]MBT5924407.1 hypothetical protein [Candidatus Woesearchaeota archaeon]MBT6367197.1 hypothetical protein [Candidatus Woesearchaeota archaeon]MBT7762657.1 hypothetical protein [Candidatus Woesearchaeota archaeon]